MTSTPTYDVAQYCRQKISKTTEYSTTLQGTEEFITENALKP